MTIVRTRLFTDGHFLRNKLIIHFLKVLRIVPLTPTIFLLLKKSASFPDFISGKIISIDKILAFLQAFEHVISMFTTAKVGSGSGY